MHTRLIHQTHARHKQMAEDDERRQVILFVIQRLEEYNAPESVQQDKGQCRVRGDKKEITVTPGNAHCPRTRSIGQNIDQCERTANGTKTQSGHCVQQKGKHQQEL